MMSTTYNVLNNLVLILNFSKSSSKNHQSLTETASQVTLRAFNKVGFTLTKIRTKHIQGGCNGLRPRIKFMCH